jgi:transglutaminase-like putative cysteine protease
VLLAGLVLVLLARVALLLAGPPAALESGGDPWTTTARYELDYRVKLADVAPAGSRVALWVPYPAENAAQALRRVKVESPWPWSLHTEEKLGNRMIYTEGSAGVGVRDFMMTIEVDRSPYHGVSADRDRLVGALNPALYEGADHLIPLSGVIKEIADKEGEGHASKKEKMRAFYDYVYRTMTYDKNGTGWGRGDAVWACANKRGNCTDFHSLLIGMLRSQGIPARFLIGFPIPDANEGEIGGYHCWAEIYDETNGWLPVDASEAKKKWLKDAYFGALPNDRIEFSVGRDLRLDPPQEGEPRNYFIHPYAEIDGKPLGDLQASLRFRRLPSGIGS